MRSHELGKVTELKVAEFFSNKGYWVYQCPRTPAGQPADLILAKDNIITLMEVKHCKNDRFTLNRIEPNQLTTFGFFRNKGNKEHKILIEFNSGTYLMDFSYIKEFINQGLKSITVADLEELGERIWI